MPRVSPRDSFEPRLNLGGRCVGWVNRSEVAMNTPLIFLTVVVLGAGSAMAVMNNA
jgi:hypothetical protein